MKGGSKQTFWFGNIRKFLFVYIFVWGGRTCSGCWHATDWLGGGARDSRSVERRQDRLEREKQQSKSVCEERKKRGGIDAGCMTDIIYTQRHSRRVANGAHGQRRLRNPFFFVFSKKRRDFFFSQNDFGKDGNKLEVKKMDRHTFVDNF